MVSYGGGVNSTALLIGLHQHRIPVDLILFADTGAEHPHTYAYLDIMDRWLKDHGMPPITRVYKTTRDGKRLTLEQECLQSGTLPSMAYGFKRCSLKHKIGPQEKFCNHYPPCRKVWAAGKRVVKFIGYDAGEGYRSDKVLLGDLADPKYSKWYPLMEWRWDRAACQRAIDDAGLPQPTAGRRAVSRAGHPAASGGRGRKKAAATTPASAGEAVPTTAPVPERQPAERPMDAAALAAEADRLAAEYGLSSSGGGLVVLPGDDDWDDFPAPPDREASSARTAARGTETVPAASFPEPVPAAAPFAAATPVAPAPEATPAEGKSSPGRRRGGGTTAAPVAGSGNASVPLAGEKGGTSPAAPGDARMPEGSPAPVPGAVSSVSAGHRAEGEANGTARPAASPVAGAPCPAPSSGTGMGRREAAFRQWAADMQARFDAGLEAEEDRAARRKDSLVVLPPPTDTGGRKRRTAKKAQADAAEAPRPRTWITRRRSTEPGHEARFEEWHGPARTGSVLEKVFISLGASPEQAKLSRLWRSWDAVLGPDLAPLARPLGHHDDKLLIGAEDAVLLQELYYMGPEIVRRVNEFLQEDFFTAVKVSLMLDHQDLDAPSPVLERSAGRPKEEVPAPSGASLGLMDPESAVARCYARFLGMELPDPRK